MVDQHSTETRSTDVKAGENRRDMLKGLLAIVGTGTLAACGQSGSSEPLPDGVLYPKGDPRNGASSGFYSPELKSFVSRLSDILLPDTDSPGAIAAGVPERLELVLDNWLDQEGRIDWLTRVERVLGAIDGQAEGSFLALSDAEQVEIVRSFDELAFGAGGDGTGSYKMLKREIVSAYYTTEVGCTEELQWLAVPGDWRACVPLKEIGRTWAA